MTSSKNIRTKWQHIILYGAAMALLLMLLKWLEYRYLMSETTVEVYIGLVALLFTGIGVWVARQLANGKTKTAVVEKTVYVTEEKDIGINKQALADLNLTEREYEVLVLITQGLSNGEIADKLYLSLSTIKTHVSNLFTKMEVKSRTQAAGKAKVLGIVY